VRIGLQSDINAANLGRLPPTLIHPHKGEEISPFPLYAGRLGPALSVAEGLGVPLRLNQGRIFCYLSLMCLTASSPR